MGMNALDLKQVSLENVEILQRMIPTDQEVSENTNKIYLFFFFYRFLAFY